MSKATSLSSIAHSSTCSRMQQHSAEHERRSSPSPSPVPDSFTGNNRRNSDRQNYWVRRSVRTTAAHLNNNCRNISCSGGDIQMEDCCDYHEVVLGRPLTEDDLLKKAIELSIQKQDENRNDELARKCGVDVGVNKAAVNATVENVTSCYDKHCTNELTKNESVDVSESKKKSKSLVDRPSSPPFEGWDGRGLKKYFLTFKKDANGINRKPVIDNGKNLKRKKIKMESVGVSEVLKKKIKKKPIKKRQLQFHLSSVTPSSVTSPAVVIPDNNRIKIEKHEISKDKMKINHICNSNRSEIVSKSLPEKHVPIQKKVIVKSIAKPESSKANIGITIEEESASNSHWVRRSVRQPHKSALLNPHVVELLSKLRSNSLDVEVLKLKRFIGPDAPQLVMNSILDALMVNTSCQALYIQNFNEGMRDEQMMHLLKVLEKGFIWCLNIGETYKVKTRTWEKFAKGLKKTNLTHTYASEHTISTKLKDKIRTIIRKNRRKHDRHINPNNLNVIVQCTHCWWNPINAKKLRPYVGKYFASYNDQSVTSQFNESRVFINSWKDNDVTSGMIESSPDILGNFQQFSMPNLVSDVSCQHEQNSTDDEALTTSSPSQTLIDIGHANEPVGATYAAMMAAASRFNTMDEDDNYVEYSDFEVGFE